MKKNTSYHENWILSWGVYIRRNTGGGAQAMNYRIDTEILEKKQFADIQNDPKVMGLALPMPMKLVKPVSINREDINPPGITWGVSVTRANDSPFTGSGVTVAVLDTGIGCLSLSKERRVWLSVRFDKHCTNGATNNPVSSMEA